MEVQPIVLIIAVGLTPRLLTRAPRLGEQSRGQADGVDQNDRLNFHGPARWKPGESRW